MGRRCGESGSWRGELVPDEVPFPPCVKTAKFWKACRGHDDCYETLGRSKSDCDKEFRKALESQCRSAYPGVLQKTCLLKCLAAARLYYEAVSRAGGDAYRRAQKKARERAGRGR